MNNELGRILKVAIKVSFEVLSCNFPGQTEEEHKTPLSEKPVCKPRFKIRTSWIWNGSANKSAAMLSSCTPVILDTDPKEE